MAVSYAGSFSELDVIIENAEGLADVVYTIHWRLNADDGEGHTASTIGTSSVTYDPDGPDPFIPFEDLTEAVVQNWTISQITEEGVEQMESSLAGQLAEMEHPTHETMRGDELPWNESNGA